MRAPLPPRRRRPPHRVRLPRRPESRSTDPAMVPGVSHPETRRDVEATLQTGHQRLDGGAGRRVS